MYQFDALHAMTG